jgi:hypothetical protein
MRKQVPTLLDALLSIRNPKSAFRNFSLAGLLYRAGCRIVGGEILKAKHGDASAGRQFNFAAV